MNEINKYFSVFLIQWQNGLVYRLNFVLWRVRSVLQLLLVYFIWWTAFESQQEIFGYTQVSILTYVLVAAIIRAIILSSRVMDIVNQINDGSIVNFLVKPLDFIWFYFSRDFADKFLNIAFVILEVLMILILLKPPIVIQTDISTLMLFILATALGLLLFFAISFILGLSAFWVENSWGPFFLLFTFVEGFGGGLFPIDILPKAMAQILLLTPFPYLVYFPAKVYLGTLTPDQLIQGFMILILWVVTGMYLMVKTLQAGLRTYTAVGH